MNLDIKQSTPSPELNAHIYNEFHTHAVTSTGINGLAEGPVSFEIHNRDRLIGCVVAQMFWGQLHIKYLIVDEKYRNQGIGKKLIKHTFEYAKSRECQFVFVETMSFQTPKFYQKLGFKVELKRDGYDMGTSFYYLCKNLHAKAST